MQQTKQKIYNQTIDILRIISILAVICIHTTTRTLEATSYDLRTYPWTLFLNQAARFAVPLFFIISGFVLSLNYSAHTSYFAYLKKRLSKILIPYVFWSGIYFFVIYPRHIQYFFHALRTGGASYQLYFIPTLLIFYLLFPLMYRMLWILSKKWLLIPLGILQFGLLYYDYSIHPLLHFSPLYFAILNFYPFILGSIAAHHEQHLMTIIQRWKYALILLTLFLVGFIFFEGEHGYLTTHNYLAFYSQWRPSVLLYTIALGSGLYYFLTTRIRQSGYIKKLAPLSFLVFFIHVAVLEMAWKYIGKVVFAQLHTHHIVFVLFDPFLFLLTAGISFFLAFMIQKIPFLKKIAG